MKKFGRITSIMGLELITFDQFIISVISKSHAHQIVEEYEMETHPMHFSERGKEAWIDKDPGEDATYSRLTVQVINLSLRGLKRQYLEQLVIGEAPRLIGSKKNLEESIYEAKRIAQDNFSDPKYIIDIGQAQYVIADVDSQTIGLKILSPTQGVLILYKPAFHVLLELTK